MGWPDQSSYLKFSDLLKMFGSHEFRIIKPKFRTLKIRSNQNKLFVLKNWIGLEVSLARIIVLIFSYCNFFFFFEEICFEIQEVQVIILLWLAWKSYIKDIEWKYWEKISQKKIKDTKRLPASLTNQTS